MNHKLKINKPLSKETYLSVAAALAAAASNADAAVISGNLNAIIGDDESITPPVSYDFNIDGMFGSFDDEFSFFGGTSFGAGLGVIGLNSLNAAILLTTGGNPLNVAYGEWIFGYGAFTWQWATSGSRNIFSYNTGWDTNFNFSEGNTGYLGVRFFGESSNPLYGWIEIDWIAVDGSEFHIADYGFESSGGPIQAGDTGAVPEPSGLALMALGAAGISAWRRRKNKAAQTAE